MSYKIVIDSCGELPESWKADEKIERYSPYFNRGGRRYCR